MITYLVKSSVNDLAKRLCSEEIIELANKCRRSFEAFGMPKGEWIETEEEAVEYLRSIDYEVTIND